jgi:hypothetical protein
MQSKRIPICLGSVASPSPRLEEDPAMQMKLESTYEDLKAYVERQMDVIDTAVKSAVSMGQVKLAMDEIAAVNKIAGVHGWHFNVEPANYPDGEALTAYYREGRMKASSSNPVA